MATSATTACPIQISVLLDSGVFLNELYDEKYSECRVGYFSPQFRIYSDWNSVTSPDLANLPSDSRSINIRVIDSSDKEKEDGVTFSRDLRNHILLRQTIYEDEPYSPPVIETRFDWIFGFKSGFFRCSSVKNRFFKQINGSTHLPNSKRQEYLDIAHDIVIHYELAEGERLEIVVGDRVLWKTTDYPSVRSRFDIEIIGPHATAENYFRDALDHRGNDYWLPNQGDPGPIGGRP